MKDLQEVLAHFFPACHWDDGNPVFQVNQFAIASSQQLTAWDKKEQSASEIHFGSTSTLLQDQLLSIFPLIFVIQTQNTSPYIPLLLICGTLSRVGANSVGMRGHVYGLTMFVRRIVGNILRWSRETL